MITHDPKSFRCEMADIRAARLCAGGARQWFKTYSLSYSDFVTNGISADMIVALGDPIGMRVVEQAERRSFPNG